jgi:CHAT domain-containing protein
MKFITLPFFLLFSFFVSGQSLQVAQNYLDRSDYNLAVPLYEKITEKAKRSKNLNLQVSAQNGLADCYLDLGAKYKAMAILKQNIVLLNNSKTKNYFLLAKTHQLLAICYDKLFLIEDYLEECNTFYNYYKKAAPEKEIYKALYYAYLGRYYNIRGIVDKAFGYTNAALKIYHKHPEEKEVDPYIFYNAHLFTIRNNGTTDSKTLQFRDSVSFILNKRYPFDNLKKARLLISLAAPNLDSVERILNKDSEKLIFNADVAINYYKKLIAINNKHSGYYDSNAANAFSLIGLMYFYKKDYENAIKCYDEGIRKMSIYNSNRTDFYSINNLTHIGLFNWKTWCLNVMYDNTNNINLLYQIESDLKILEKIWIRYSNQIIKSKENYNNNGYVDCPYLLMVNNYKKLYDLTGQNIYLTKIYEYDEKSRYSSLLENQIKSTNSISDLSDNKLKDAFEDLLLQKNSKLTNYLYNKETITNFDLLLKTISKKEQADNSKIESRFYKLNQIQTNLKDTDAMIFYNYTGNHNNEFAYSILITKNKYQIINLNKDTNPSSFYNFKNEDILHSLYKNDIVSFKNQTYLFYKNYFEPIEKLLPKSIKNICVVPSGIINNIPFDYIINSPSKEIISFKELPYLLKKYNFSYSLSPSLSNINNQEKAKNNHFSLFSPTFDTVKMANLDIAANECEVISKEYKPIYFKGSEASVSSFSHSLANDNSLLLFSHGIGTTKELDEQKGVYLSDGFLCMKDIYKLKSNCSFLLLGACETGVGYESREGNINLARAFTAIGVKSMLLASWKIDEQSSTKIISSFLKYLDAGCTKSEALQKAKLDYLSTASPRMSNPLYWAGLTITGNNETIRLQQHNYWWWGLGLIPVICCGVYYKKLRKLFLKLL